MTPQEANKIIAEYMGKAWANEWLLLEGYISLDALVPVWEKLDLPCDYEFLSPREAKDPRWTFRIQKGFKDNGKPTNNYQWQCENTIQEAAAIATAKAIKELE